MLLKIKNFLTEGGFLEKNKDTYKILKPVVDSDVIDEIKENGDKKILKIMFYQNGEDNERQIKRID